METFPEAQPGKQTFYRPIGGSFRFILSHVDDHSLTRSIVNGCELPACFCGEGEIEAAAKEASCKSIVVAIGCVSSYSHLMSRTRL